MPPKAGKVLDKVFRCSAQAPISVLGKCGHKITLCSFAEPSVPGLLAQDNSVLLETLLMVYRCLQSHPCRRQPEVFCLLPKPSKPFPRTGLAF